CGASARLFGARLARAPPSPCAASRRPSRRRFGVRRGRAAPPLVQRLLDGIASDPVLAAEYLRGERP
ncbi:MAG: hypothetical protein ACO3RU_04725, partial [Planctomycetota bacterium]